MFAGNQSLKRFSSQTSSARKISVRVDSQGNREESIEQYVGVPFKLPEVPIASYPTKMSQNDLLDLLTPLKQSIWLHENECFDNLLNALGNVQKKNWTPYFVSALFTAEDNVTVLNDGKYSMTVTLAGDPSSSNVTLFPFGNDSRKIQDLFVTLKDDNDNSVSGIVGSLNSVTTLTIPTPTNLPVTYHAVFA